MKTVSPKVTVDAPRRVVMFGVVNWARPAWTESSNAAAVAAFAIA
ncbi:MAG: hypothetical protein JWM59_931 [Verrucomicrobiales bacterium]|nr:hypothetical protein [Verrucomicrobiales bacterium]